ncbi:Mak10-domain-containing protein [Lactarius psammicola]|nr:Mak10-domain-containing protein [Lactarius psammicola]
MSSELSTPWLPGGDDFVDVSDTFLNAVQGELYLRPVKNIDGLNNRSRGNQDAFSPSSLVNPGPVQIGDPRMDSGLILDDEAERLVFSPLTPLLPEEVCYVLDRAIACEMEWHAGYTLPQTIYTCLYVHHLTDIHPDVIPHQEQLQRDPARPLELVTVVIRAAIMGFLKCCDLVWRELSKGKLHDTEDWHSEKFDVSLMESTPVATVLSQLEDAKSWIQFLLPESSPWRGALLDRISLRIDLLNLFRHHPSKEREHFLVFLRSARECLQKVRSILAPEPAPHSPANFAFDPRITRKLNSFMPLRAHRLPPQNLAWDALADMFDGWAQIYKISAVASLSAWKISGDLCANFSRHSQKPPFIRALSQSAFFSNQRILEVYPLRWLVDRFFFETVGIEYNTFSAIIDRAGAPPLLNIERKLSRMLLSHVQSAWFNPPRRRRFLARSLLEWQELYDTTSTTGEKWGLLGDKDRLVVDAIPKAMLLWRLSIIEEVLLSGFQLELYVKDEKSFVYWELSQVIREHLSTLDSLERVMPKDAGAYGELIFVRSYLTSFQSFCKGMYMLMLPALHHPAERVALNFIRRYKWAFRPEYKKLRPQVAIPDLSSFANASVEILKDKREPLRQHFEQARDGLTKLDGLSAGLAGPWHEDRLRVAQSLSSIAGELALAVPATIVGVNDFDTAKLDWARLPCRWFPGISAI